MQKISKEDAQRALVSLVIDELETYEKEQFWITDSVAFNMREMIKEFRKNYFGIYDQPKDQQTGKEKIWIPLTRLLIDNVRKNVNLDPKDVRFRSKVPKKDGTTQLVRGYVREWLSNIYFNHTLNQASFTTARDGTVVWKTYFDGKFVKRKDVDLLNIYIDPTAESIQEAYRFTERVLMSKDEVRKMDWENTDLFKVEEDLEKNDGSSERKQGKFGDVYESWGKFPKHLVLAASDQDYSENDIDEEIDAHIVISGIDTGSTQFHLAEENTNRDKNGDIIKPYEEGWYIKVPGCWYGVGIAWTVMPLQAWINTTVNLRIKKNTMAQLGLLKIRRGSKVTQQMLSNLISKGVIELANPETDLQQLQIAEAGQSSYEDEKIAKNWAQEVTSVFDASLGDLPASTSATGAVIQDRQQQSAFKLIVESMEHLVQRWMDRHVLVHLPEMIKNEEYITFFKDFDDIKRVRENIVANLALESIKKSAVVPTEEQVQEEIRRAERKLEDNGDLFIEKLDEILTKNLNTEVFMTNSEIDIAVTVRNLVELRNGLDQQAINDMTAEAMDLLGLQVPNSLREPVQQAQPEQQPPAALPDLNEQQLVTGAATIGSEQR